MAKNLYIIAGCNGAGKTTASFTILPEILDCYEFVNADEIARGLSPFNSEGVAIEAGKIMLERVKFLIESGENFAFETTLSTKTFVDKIKLAKEKDYQVTLLFFWLSSPELAMNRVKKRVSQGGHNIPIDVIERRYYRGIENFFKIYQNKVDNWIFNDNTNSIPSKICEKISNQSEKIYNLELWNSIKKSIL